ncbi:gamma-glutamylcyclotransferase family protein [Streptomyces sp. NBC_01803]|uniref:gamma-glutamylcyclotransferase family protein n=1 Tax=Streptomyces sp. NBC_01803 TaxID=2975946 RepID=UPI002DD9C308|nr:gamma-glutamylcyclotransferase family protein [Streptomyces sp. NBC_01803]WSA43775.1 gamma-glutamylcyclotransferase [Streptomyces sp. NBC_01803]
MGAESLPFFVYGTLRPGQVNHDWALRGRTAAEEPAWLPGAVLYAGPGYPYAVPAPGGGADTVVSGELIHLLPGHFDAVLAVLDRLEDYAPGAPDNVYERVAAGVLRADGDPVRASLYLAAAPLAARLRASGTVIPGGDWLAPRGT